MKVNMKSLAKEKAKQENKELHSCPEGRDCEYCSSSRTHENRLSEKGDIKEQLNDLAEYEENLEEIPL